MTLRASPEDLNKSFKYTAGGLLIGGVGGAIVGSVIDEVKGPRRGTITLFLEIGDSENPYEEHITFCIRQLNLVLLNEDGLRMILKQAKRGLDRVRDYFPDKVRF